MQSFICSLLPVTSSLLLPLLAVALTHQGSAWVWVQGGETDREVRRCPLTRSGMFGCPAPRSSRRGSRHQRFFTGPKISAWLPLGLCYFDSDSTEVFFLLCEFFQMKGNSLSAYEQNKQRSRESCRALKLLLALFCFSSCC